MRPASSSCTSTTIRLPHTGARRSTLCAGCPNRPRCGIEAASLKISVV
ncbi:MAG: hypothetical protein EBS87_09625 [Sphingomonadaceae bacterium]|nr:hypothetical protein [Sphingomonadaceae bacterium]NBU79324.1 hypothetical protein [Sphingomonadaceae bacterium]NCA02417.1 hypothetical protein [Sphingomonadaceae bacterium]